jgi:SnoaL-like domain
MESTQVQDAAAASRAVGEAMRDQDFAALGEALAADVVLHSPITGAFRFEGREPVLAVLRIVRGALEDLHEIAEFGDDDTRALIFGARVGGQELQGLDVLRFDAEGRVREFRVFIRPLPGVTALAAAMAPDVARAGRTPATLVAPPMRMQAFLARVGDRVAGRILRRGFSRAG